MRKCNKIISIIFAIFCIISISSSAFADSIHVLKENPPNNTFTGDFEISGANPSGRNADIHNLSLSSYNYQAKNMGYRLYTSKWLKGASSIKITVRNWKLLEFHGGKSNQLDLIVYNSSKKPIKSKTITINGTSASTTISGLPSSSKYYICFQVPTNGNRYSYNGTISKNN